MSKEKQELDPEDMEDGYIPSPMSYRTTQFREQGTKMDQIGRHVLDLLYNTPFDKLPGLTIIPRVMVPKIARQLAMQKILDPSIHIRNDKGEIIKYTTVDELYHLFAMLLYRSVEGQAFGFGAQIAENALFEDDGGRHGRGYEFG